MNMCIEYVNVNLSVCLCLPLSASVCLCVSPSLSPSLSLSLSLPLCLSACLPACLSCLPACLPLSLSVCLFVSVCLSLYGCMHQRNAMNAMQCMYTYAFGTKTIQNSYAFCVSYIVFGLLPKTCCSCSWQYVAIVQSTTFLSCWRNKKNTCRNPYAQGVDKSCRSLRHHLCLCGFHATNFVVLRKRWVSWVTLIQNWYCLGVSILLTQESVNCRSDSWGICWGLTTIAGHQHRWTLHRIAS